MRVLQEEAMGSQLRGLGTVKVGTRGMTDTFTWESGRMVSLTEEAR
jgi:hypothetical protein